MTQQYVPQSDRRRHFLITGTYSSPDAVSSRDLQTGVEKALMKNFAEPIKILAYGTPQYHHPYAVDVREQLMKLRPEEFTALNENFPHLMVALLTFLKGAFDSEPSESPVVVEPIASAEAARRLHNQRRG